MCSLCPSELQLQKQTTTQLNSICETHIYKTPRSLNIQIPSSSGNRVAPKAEAVRQKTAREAARNGVEMNNIFEDIYDFNVGEKPIESICVSQNGERREENGLLIETSRHKRPKVNILFFFTGAWNFK